MAHRVPSLAAARLARDRRACGDVAPGAGTKLYVTDLHGQCVGVALAVEVGRDPALHLVHLQQLGRVTQRRADDVAHTWLALQLVAQLWHVRGDGPPEDYEPALGMETSTGFRLMRWLVMQSPDAATWWQGMERALDGPPLQQGRPDGRRDLLYCASCGEVVNAEARGRRWCLVCESLERSSGAPDEPPKGSVPDGGFTREDR